MLMLEFPFSSDQFGSVGMAEFPMLPDLTVVLAVVPGNNCIFKH